MKVNEGRTYSVKGGGGGGRGGGGGERRDEVWDRETMFSQLAKWSPRVVVSGKLLCIFHKENISEAGNEPAEKKFSY